MCYIFVSRINGVENEARIKNAVKTVKIDTKTAVKTVMKDTKTVMRDTKTESIETKIGNERDVTSPAELE